MTLISKDTLRELKTLDTDQLMRIIILLKMGQIYMKDEDEELQNLMRLVS